MAFKIKAKKKKRPKRGSEYEKVVAEVVRVFDPHSMVTQGEWINGPDGKRELDVLIAGGADGRSFKGIIECKDFNPGTTGPVGIAYVDALESKRRDMGADFSLICSNAGFTADAIRKAKRVNIGLISVMRMGDSRIRFAVAEEIYTRKVTLISATLALTGSKPINLEGVSFDDVRYEGKPVANWVYARIMLLLGSNPIVNGSFSATHKLTAPIRFDWSSGGGEASNLDINFKIEGAWYSHRVEIDSTTAIYDWVRRRARLAPGGGQLQIKELDIHAGEHISLPPDRELIREQFLKGEADLKFILIKNIPEPKPKPDLDRFIVSEDLELCLPELPSEVITWRFQVPSATGE